MRKYRFRMRWIDAFIAGAPADGVALRQLLQRGLDGALEGGDIAELVGEQQRQPGQEQRLALPPAVSIAVASAS